jgi:hypothetical protein
MSGNVAILEVHSLMYVVLSEAESNVSYGGFVGTNQCITLWPRRRINSSRYNRVAARVAQSV